MAQDTTVLSYLARSRVVLLVQLSVDGVIEACNDALRALTGRPEDALVGRPLADFLARHEESALPSPVEPTDARFLLNLLDVREDPHTYECSVVRQGAERWLIAEPMQATEHDLRRELVELNNRLAVATRENARTARELAAALEDLKASHWHIRKIQEVLPLCMECGRVKGETQWEDVVQYLRKHARFLSHGYCTDCAEMLRAERALEQRSTGQEPV